jgi:hypothetical protein
MSALNWERFEGLPGATTSNFETLCRAIIHRHYAQFGDFRALANQPGVEFHLKLTAPCALGNAGRWYGWQCRWYGLASGSAIGTTRRRKIEEAIALTEEHLPGLTDWVLWTRYPLTRGDQEWFYGLHTKMHLLLWTSAEAEEHLSGPAELLRATYFGELILTPDLLQSLHEEAVAPIKRRWNPDVHQVIDAERSLLRIMATVEAWSDLLEIGGLIDHDVSKLQSEITAAPKSMTPKIATLIECAKMMRGATTIAHEAIAQGNFETAGEQASTLKAPGAEERNLLRALRARNNPLVLYATNVVADMSGAYEVLSSIAGILKGRLVVVIADAGCGKTELSAQLTAPTRDRSAGVLLRGKNLSAGEGLDHLARRIAIHGKPIESFEGLVAAVDAAGQRQGRRLPIVIDGLNEAEDPRDWKDELTSLGVVLPRYPNSQIICTLRSAFVTEAAPEGADHLEIEGFEEDVVEAVRRYFKYYRIDATDAELPLELLSHPLTLRIYCEVTNPNRQKMVDVGAIPASMTTLFERYLDQVAERITEFAPPGHRYYASDVRTALNTIGLLLWDAGARAIDLQILRRLLGDENRAWDQSIVRALEEDGVLFREPGDGGLGQMSIVYDALAGYIVADALLGRYAGDAFDEWIRQKQTSGRLIPYYRERLTGAERLYRFVLRKVPTTWRPFIARKLNPDRITDSARHPLAGDIFSSLAGLTPRRMNRKQLWPLLSGSLRMEGTLPVSAALRS